METNGDSFKQILSNNYCCNVCDYNTSRKSNLENHYKSIKHRDAVAGDGKLSMLKQNQQFVCENCNKSYMSRNGLWKHKSKCSDSNICNSAEPTDKEIILLLIKENAEFKNIIMKVLENGTNNITNTHTNSHNKAFNLNFFLNETCKDAMNIMDFVESIQLQVSDLERVGEVGYVEGISDIIVSNLNKLDITQRPIHCTDKKRETMYIKDAGKWEKDENTNLIRKAIRKVTHNNQRLLPQFKEKYPDYHNYYSSHSDKVTKVVVETMVNNVPDKEEKIIRNIAKSVVLNRGT